MRYPRVPKLLLLFSAVVMLTSSCGRNVLYDENHGFEGGIWRSSDIVKFNVEITDSKQPYNVYLNVRNTTDYEYSNLFLFVKTFYPDGKISIDTLECFLADTEGRWLGKRSGRMVDARLQFRRNVVFTETGRYSFEFEQAMRDESLEGIENFGMRIEKAQLQK